MSGHLRMTPHDQTAPPTPIPHPIHAKSLLGINARPSAGCWCTSFLSTSEILINMGYFHDEFTLPTKHAKRPMAPAIHSERFSSNLFVRNKRDTQHISTAYCSPGFRILIQNTQFFVFSTPISGVRVQAAATASPVLSGRPSRRKDPPPAS